MAGKAHADGTAEKKLRPIYDCLDFGNNKKALQEADKILKKYRDLQCAKALKALALIRLGRAKEAVPVLEEVHSEKPTSEATLQTMSMCYREAGKLELVAEVYDNACKTKPDNEELLTQLFMAYVRLGNYKKQQQTALQLHKLRPDNNPYLYWNVMSIVLQANESDETLARSMFLPLAEKMVRKQIESNGIGSPSEILLMLIILEKLGKYDDALAVLQGSLGSSLDRDIFMKDLRIADLLSRMQRWGEAGAEFRKLAVKSPDAWSYYSRYFQAILQDIHHATDTTSVSPTDAVMTAVTFVNECITGVKGNEDQLQRGPHIAQMDLFCLLKERSLDTSSLGLLKDLVLNYCRLFGDKYCCFEDLMRFWDFLDPNDRSQVLFSMDEDVQKLLAKESVSDFATDVKVMQRHILLLQIKCRLSYSGFHVLKDLSVMSDELFLRYLKGISVEKEAQATGLKTCDSYLLLGIFCILDTWAQIKDQQLLLRACTWLETGIFLSPANYYFKVLLIKVYSILGVFSPVPELLMLLDVKHIQFDSLGYLFCNDALRWGHITTATSLLNSVLKFFTLSGREVNENLISCYRYGSFTKVEEFIKFRNRLQNSFQFASSTVDRLLAEIRNENRRYQSDDHVLSQVSIDPAKDATEWSSLIDNRDFDILPQWTSAAQLDTRVWQQASFEEEKAWLRFRNLTSRILAAAVQITDSMISPTNAVQLKSNGFSDAVAFGEARMDTMVTTLSALLLEFDQHLLECKQCSMYHQAPKFDPRGPSLTRIRQFLQLDHGVLLSQLGHSVLYIYRLLFSTEPVDGSDATVDQARLTGIAEQFKGVIDATIKRTVVSCIDGTATEACFTLHPDVLEESVLHAEALAYSAVMLDACARMTTHAGVSTAEQASSQSKRKGKRAQGQHPPESVSKSLPVQAVAAACSALKQLDEQLLVSADLLSNYLVTTAESLKDALLAENVGVQLSLADCSDTDAAVPHPACCGDKHCKDIPLSKDDQEQRSRRIVWSNIEKSYQQTIKETVDLLKCKTLFLQGLTF